MPTLSTLYVCIYILCEQPFYNNLHNHNNNGEDDNMYGDGVDTDSPCNAMESCYSSSLSLAFDQDEYEYIISSERPNGSSIKKVACPLIGAGARGFPIDVAIDIAVRKSLEWMKDGESPSATSSNSYEVDGSIVQDDKKSNEERNQLSSSSSLELVLAFGIPNQSIAESLVLAFEEEQGRTPKNKK